MGEAKKAAKRSSITVTLQKYNIWKFQVISPTSLHLHQTELQVSWIILSFLYQFGSDFKIINPLDISRDLCAGTRPMAKPAARKNTTCMFTGYISVLGAGFKRTTLVFEGATL